MPISRPKIISGLSLAILAGAILYGLYQARQAAARRLQPGSLMPSFQLHDADGNLVTEKDFSGRNYGLLFYRTDCGYCQRELTEIDRLQPQFTGRLSILPVSLNSAEETRRAGEQWRLTMISYIAPATLAQELGVRSVPLLILVGADGRIAYVQSGERSPTFQLMVLERFLDGGGLAEADLRQMARRPIPDHPAAGGGCAIPKESK